MKNRAAHSTMRRVLIAVRRTALTLVVASAPGLLLEPADAQQANPIISLDQLQQLQNRGPTTVVPGVTQRETILEPQAPANPTLPTSRLEQIMSDKSGIRISQFGYDQLGVGRSVSLPQAGSMQDDYILGPGDEIVVSLRGQENAEYRTAVDRDGRVVLPRMAPVSAGGRRLGDFRRDMVDAIHRAYVSTEGFVSVGALRQISVMVTGEVGSPGMRTLTGLSTPTDAILVSGGVNKTGSLRNIYISRGNQRISVDLYGLLTGTTHASQLPLADGDRIVVPALGPTVAIVGWVRRQAIYEIGNGRTSMTVRELMSLAGGLEVRGKYRLSVLRVTADGRNQMVSLNGESDVIGDSDVLFVQPAASQTANMATLSGGTALAGQYRAGAKLSEYLNSPGALGQDPYTLFGVISRRDPATLLRLLVPFTPVAVLRGTQDIIIQGDDIVRVISTKEARILFEAIQQFQLRNQATQEALRNPQAATAVQAANTPNVGASSALAAQTAAQETAGPTGSAQRQAVASAVNQISQTASTQQAGVVPGTITTGAEKTGGWQNPAQVPGSTAPAGAVASPDMEVGSSTQGNVPTNLEVSRVTDLASQLRVDPLVLMNFLEDRSISVDGEVQGPGLYLVGPDADIQSVVTAAGGLGRWADRSAVEVISTSVDTNAGRSQTTRRTLSLVGDADAGYIVSPHDEVRFNEVFTSVGVGSITLQGQVRYAGTYQIVRGEHLSDVLMRAGGLTDSAYPYGTIFLRRSAAQREQGAFQREAREVENQLIIAMSRRDPNAKLSPDAFTAMQAYVNEIKNQQALGRITVVADPAALAANPALDPLLEPGDVVFVPQRPYSVAILGQVLQPGSVPFEPNMSFSDYIDRAGGYSQFADQSETILVLPDGTARRLNGSWFHFGSDDIPPGSTIFVGRDVSGIDLHQIVVDSTAIISQLAVSAASLAVLATQVK